MPDGARAQSVYHGPFGIGSLFPNGPWCHGRSWLHETISEYPQSQFLQAGVKREPGDRCGPRDVRRRARTLRSPPAGRTGHIVRDDVSGRAGIDCASRGYLGQAIGRGGCCLRGGSARERPDRDPRPGRADRRGAGPAGWRQGTLPAGRALRGGGQCCLPGGRVVGR